MSRYGIPYKGSKNDIAGWVVEHLPPSRILIDLFAGGCAVTHAALVSGKFSYVLANDVNDAPRLFFDAISGKYRNESRWISREDFFALKDTDPYVRYIWSFGNNGENYLYGKNIEAYKKAYHYAAMFEDYSLFEAMGIEIPDAVKEKTHWQYGSPIHRKMVLGRFLEKNEELKKSLQVSKEHINRLQNLQSLKSLQNLESLQRLQRLQSLQSLQRHTDRLTIMQVDYANVPLPPDCTIYCDPPYAGTNCGSYSGFDHERFYQWLRTIDRPVVVSEYAMPDDFVCIAECRKMVKSVAVGAIAGVERLFCHESQVDKFKIEQFLC